MLLRQRVPAPVPALVGFLAALALVASGLVVTGPPAAAARLDLHKGSRGGTVRLLETRLAALSFLTPSAVDRRYRAATVNAVRAFQWRLGLPVTGRVDRRTWDTILREPGRRAAAPDPFLIGHRGQVTTRTGENTLGSLRLAAPHVAMLEFDLHLTADKVLVLMHDSTLDRTTGCSGRVSSWTAADLRQTCRVGAQTIPTFAEAAEYAASVGLPIAPELKDARMSQGDLASFVQVVRANGLESRTWVQSVFGSRFSALLDLEPRLRTVLVSAGAPSPATVRATGAKAVAAAGSTLNIPRVRAYHGAGLKVWAWTARTAAEIRMSSAMRVDGVVVDAPAVARSIYR